MSVEIETHITCDGCGDTSLDEGNTIYCEECYDRLMGELEELEAEIDDLRQGNLELTQENEELKDNAK